MQNLESKLVEITPEVTEIQLWSNEQMIGAGAWTNPITQSKMTEATRRIIDVWLMTP